VRAGHVPGSRSRPALGAACCSSSVPVTIACAPPLRQRSLSVVSLERNPEPASAAFGLRIGIVPGVTPDKWTQRWKERHPEIPYAIVALNDADARSALDAGAASICFLRLPVAEDGLSVIRLYRERTVLAVSRDTPLAAVEQLTELRVSQLPGVVRYPPQTSITDAVALVAAGVGVLRLPASVARMTARKDVVLIPIVDAPETEIALCWLTDATTEVIDEFIGVVRGRTAASSRGAVPVVKRSPRRGR
jgi:DNA-binding transcriptional LysR family regulator